MMPLLIGIYFYIQLGCIYHILYRKSISFKNQQLKQPQYFRCFHGCHGDKYADVLILKEKYSNLNKLPAIRYFDKFIFHQEKISVLKPVLKE